MNKLHTGIPFTIAGIRIIPIEQTCIRSDKYSSLYWLNAAKEAVAIVICGPDGVQAVDINAQKLSIEDLAAEVPDLKAMITQLSVTQ